MAKVRTILPAEGEALQLNRRKTRARPETKNSPGPGREAEGPEGVFKVDVHREKGLPRGDP